MMRLIRKLRLLIALLLGRRLSPLERHFARFGVVLALCGVSGCASLAFSGEQYTVSQRPNGCVFGWCPQQQRSEVRGQRSVAAPKPAVPSVPVSAPDVRGLVGAEVQRLRTELHARLCEEIDLEIQRLRPAIREELGQQLPALKTLLRGELAQQLQALPPGLKADGVDELITSALPRIREHALADVLPKLQTLQRLLSKLPVEKLLAAEGGGAAAIGLGALGGPAGIGVAAGGVALSSVLSWWIAKKKAVVTARIERSRPVVVTTQSPPLPQQVIHTNTFTPVNSDQTAEALAWAVDQAGRKHPGSVATLELLLSLVEQFIAAKRKT